MFFNTRYFSVRVGIKKKKNSLRYYNIVNILYINTRSIKTVVDKMSMSLCFSIVRRITACKSKVLFLLPSEVITDLLLIRIMY